MIKLLCTRELATEITASSKPGRLVVHLVSPGSVRTDLNRDAEYRRKLGGNALKAVLSRSAEEGSRTLVAAAEGGDWTHGAYLDDCRVGR